MLQPFRYEDCRENINNIKGLGFQLVAVIG